jgi:hypothetical protein
MKHAASSHHRAKWPWIIGVLSILVLLVGLAAYSALAARSRAQSALADFQYVEQNISSVSSAPGRAALEAHLQDALLSSHEANSSLKSTIVLSALQWVPYFGNEIRGASSLISDASSAAVDGLTMIRALDAFQRADAKGTITTKSLARLQTVVATASTNVRTLKRPVGSLFGPVGRERVAFNQKVRKAAKELSNVNAGLTVGRSLLGDGGTSSVLVLPENNAEMRNQGSILSYSLLRIHNTDISVVRSGHSYDLNLPSPLKVPISPGAKQYLLVNEPNQIWQSVNSTADFAWTGSTAAAMFYKATGVKVNDIIALDVPTMAALLNVTGPLSVPGIPEVLTSSNFSTVVLHDLYSAFPVGNQEPRYSYLNSIATILLQRLKSDHHDQVAFLRALAGEIPGRHLLLWSASPTVENAITQLGASGKVNLTMPKRTFTVGVESDVADKMDYYISLHENYSVSIHKNGSASVRTTVIEDNAAPAGQAPSYQLGPSNPYAVGEYVSNIYLWSPSGSTVENGYSDSGLVLSGITAKVLPQQSSTTSFETYIPHAMENGRLDLHFVPQPTLNPVDVSVSVHGVGWKISGPTTTPFVLDQPTTLRFDVRKN